MTIAKYLLVMLLIALTAGCAAHTRQDAVTIPKLEARYYPQCIRPLVGMQEADSRVTQQTARSAIGGALAGAIIGILTTGRLEGAIAGLIGGAVSGAAIGYTFAKFDQIADENTRFASIRITANQDLSKANRLQLYSYECLQCYLYEFEKLQEDYEGGRILKEEYTQRFTEIRKSMIALGKVIGNMDEEITRTEKEFATSFTRTAAKAAPAPVATPATAPASPKKAVRAAAHPRRAGTRRLSATLAEKRARIEKAQEKNDEDLTAMLSEFAGKVRPPRQDSRTIEKNYGESYTEARQQMEDLRTTHREALEIMDKAAIEAGIDMV